MVRPVPPSSSSGSQFLGMIEYLVSIWPPAFAAGKKFTTEASPPRLVSLVLVRRGSGIIGGKLSARQKGKGSSSSALLARCDFTYSQEIPTPPPPPLPLTPTPLRRAQVLSEPYRHHAVHPPALDPRRALLRPHPLRILFSRTLHRLRLDQRQPAH